MVHNSIQSHVEFLIEQNKIEGFTHVIEYSAYEQLQAKLDEAVKALEFYADESNMTSLTGLPFGKRARQALQKIRGEV